VSFTGQAPRDGVSARCGLTEGELVDVGRLTDICNRHDGLDLAFNLETAVPGGGPDQFLYYRGGALAGFLSMYHGSDGPEVCVAVHPEHRRRGIGRALVDVAKDACRARGIGRWLFVCEYVSAAGRAFVEAARARYRFSEYRMRYEAGGGAPEDPPGPPLLRRAGVEDVDFVVRARTVSFGRPEDATRERVVRNLAKPTHRIYVARVEGGPVGTLGVNEEGHVYIVGFAVLPEHRGRGIGRRMLSEVVRVLRSEGWTDIRIEVATANENALSLYRSCGFQETATYGFYEMVL